MKHPYLFIAATCAAVSGTLAAAITAARAAGRREEAEAQQREQKLDEEYESLRHGDEDGSWH